MNPWGYIALTAVGVTAIAAAALYWWRRKVKTEPVRKTDPGEETFIAEWTAVLTDDARVFNGLFSGLQRIADGTAKRPEKVLREWCQRTHYKWEGAAADALCQERICPLIEASDRDAMASWAQRLLTAAARAGVTRDAAAHLTLTDHNAADYVADDGEDLYPGDEVDVLKPAWYQNGRLLEQGQCRKTDPA